MKNLRLTESEIEDYINFTVTSGEYHIKEEFRWFINVLKEHNCNDALNSIREVSTEWKKES